jgi:chemotaxis protein methyltransferase CheR
MMEFSQQSFNAVVAMFESAAGIKYGPDKKQTVAMRLMRLASDRGAKSIDAYLDETLGGNDTDEITRIIDRLTTNETYFFREPAHFDFLENMLEGHDRSQPFRVWSAASSSGEEAYSVAMVLADRLGVGADWEVVGTDLSSAMVASARAGLYGMERIEGIGRQRLQRYCLKGTGPYANKLLMARELRARVRFELANLAKPLSPMLQLGKFNVIFLRNVLIYFDADAKRQIVERVVSHLASGGIFFTGHAETLTGVTWELAALQPAVYERAG